MGIAHKISDLALSPSFNMTVYPGTGTADGTSGDHIIIAPSYLVKEEDIDHIVRVVSTVIRLVFNKLDTDEKWWKRLFKRLLPSK